MKQTIAIVYIPFAAVNIIGLPDVINIVCSCWATNPPLSPVKVQPSGAVTVHVDLVEINVSIATMESFLNRLYLSWRS